MFWSPFFGASTARGREGKWKSPNPQQREHVTYFTPFCTTLVRLVSPGVADGADSGMLGLKWNDVDLILGEVSVTRSLHHLRDGSYIFTDPKSAKSRRTIALPPSAILTLREHYEKQKLERAMLGIPLTGDDLVFSTLEGKPLRPNTVTRAWSILATRCGVKVIRLHDARHTHASLMLKQGIHPKIVQERLGHATIAITLDTYSHVAPGLQEAAADQFDKLVSPRYNDTVENAPVENDY